MGLLSSMGSQIGGLLGDPRMKESLLAAFAAGGDPERLQMIMKSKMEKEEKERLKKLYDLQLAEAEAAQKARQKAEGKAQWSEDWQQSMGLLTPENRAKYMTPEAQQKIRLSAGAHGDPKMLEQAGLLAPIQPPQQYAPPEVVKLLQAAGVDPASPQGRQIIMQAAQSQAQGGAGSGTSKALIELEALAGMTPEQRADFWRIKRGAEVINVGGVPHVMTSSGEYVPYASATEVADNKATIAGAEAEAAASGKVVGERTATAALDAPKALSSSEYMIKLLDDLKAHPGKSYAVGKSSVLPVIPGTPAADFVVRLEQIGGKQFLEAFESLKGGGQITQVEGEKATQAIARMQRAQTEEEFDASVDEFRGIVEQAARRAQSAAARGAGAQRWQRAMEGGTPNSTNGGWSIRRKE